MWRLLRAAGSAHAGRHAGGSMRHARSFCAIKTIRPQEPHKVLEGWFWLGGAYPLQGYAGKLDLRHLFYNQYDFTHTLYQQADQLAEEGKYVTTIARIIPRRREGGAYVQLQVEKPSLAQVDAKRASSEAEGGAEAAEELPAIGPLEKRHETAHLEAAYEQLALRIKRLKLRVPFSGRDCKLYPVLGQPWVDDLTVPYPYSHLIVQLHGAECKQLLVEPTLEQKLWEILRPYGHIQTLELDSTRVPKDGGTFSTRVRFSKLSSAIAARASLNRADVNAMLYNLARRGQGELFPASERKNMVHLPLSATVSAATLGGADLMSVTYVPFVATNIVTNFAKQHPRVFAVLVGLGIALITYTIVEPIRSLMCRVRLQRFFEIRDSDSVQWLSHQFSRLLHPTGDPNEEKEESAIRQGKLEELERMQAYLSRPPGTILYVTGASGTGKSQMALQVYEKLQTKNSLYLNCGDGLLSLSHEEFVRALAKKIGYFPTFSSLTWMASLVDAVTPGAGKATVSSTKLSDTQMLATLTSVVRSVAKQAKASGAPAPLIIIDGCTDMNKNLQDGFMVKALRWADALTRAQVARVIFLGDSTFEAAGGISSVLPHAKVEKMVMSDVPLETALQLLERELGYMDEQLVQAAGHMGGRFTDLQILLNKLEGGVSPAEAVAQMVESATDQMRSVIFHHDESKRAFSSLQLWKLVRLMAAEEDVLYNHVLFSIFKGDDKALREVLLTELFAIVPVSNGKDRIRAGSPLLQLMFRTVMADTLLCTGLDLQVVNGSIASDVKLVRELEQELQALQLTKSDAHGTRDRQAFVENQIEDASNRIRSNDRKRRKLEKVLSSHKHADEEALDPLALVAATPL